MKKSEISQIGQILSQEVSFRIFDLIMKNSESRLTVGQCAIELGMDSHAYQYHLRRLKHLGLVEINERLSNGSKVYTGTPKLHQLMDAVQGIKAL